MRYASHERRIAQDRRARGRGYWGSLSEPFRHRNNWDGCADCEDAEAQVDRLLAVTPSATTERDRSLHALLSEARDWVDKDDPMGFDLYRRISVVLDLVLSHPSQGVTE